MTLLSIRHETRYSYEHPVRFGAHRLLVRPRDSHAIRLTDASLTLSPTGDTRWAYDSLGNSVCFFTPRGETKQLLIVSDLVIERYPATLAGRPGDPHTLTPVVYDRTDRLLLGPFMEPVTEDPGADLLSWVRSLVDQPDERALDFLLRLNSHIHQSFTYSARYEPGVQAPEFTVRLGSGTCRDFAWLMVEALRRLGYAARFVTGYLNSPAHLEVRGAGATHAWCEVFLPDLGWIEFDPTNGLAESPDLIPIAVARTPDEAAPISGALIGDPGFSQMEVHVDVRPTSELAQVA
ncbi:transglutaminase family protein [Phenylobacterium sp. LjRoot225]|uniref:transglutaminase family protein n=1 Tax=Phenylobacterium sp. LjRoot225 TaxID=3342285 RepID=UPI003ECDD1DD